MKLRTLLLCSHLVCAIVVAAATALVWNAYGGLAGQLTTVCIGGSGIAVVIWFVGAKLKRGLRLMIHSAAKADGVSFASLGIVEFDKTGKQLSEYVQRWSEMASRARQQAHDIEALTNQLDRRCSVKDSHAGSAAGHLRHLLSAITQTIDAELHQVLHCAKEIGMSTEAIADGADDQSDAVTKTATYVEQVSTLVDSVSTHARDVQAAVGSMRDVAQQSTDCVNDLTKGVNRLQAHLQANERNFRTLMDHSSEISTMIETISGIASRTDMLAINASIESVRAGEYGKGFALVAEEVHRLAEQTAHAAREVAAILDANRLETRDSIRDVAAALEEIEEEAQRVQSVRQMIERVIEISNNSADQLSEIPSSTEQQLGMIQDVLSAVERIANVAKTTRQQAEKARWTTKAMCDLTSQFDSALVPLRDSTNQRASSLRTTGREQPVSAAGEEPNLGEAASAIGQEGLAAAGIG